MIKKKEVKKTPKRKSKKKKAEEKSVKKAVKKIEKKVEKKKPASGFKVPLEELLKAGCHFGHQAKRWNPLMASYLYTVRDGIHIFDLVKTQFGLEEACKFVRDLTKKNGKIIFVGTKRQAQEIIKAEATRVGMPFVIERWLGGTIPNWEEIKKRIDRLGEMKEKREKGEYEKYTKKENLLIDREIKKLEKFFGGLTGLEKLPEAIFVVDVNREITAVKEARIKGIKVVAIVDSNSDSDIVDYVIPSNDDAVRSIKLIVEKISDAVEKERSKK